MLSTQGIQRGLDPHISATRSARPVRLRGICGCDLCGRNVRNVRSSGAARLRQWWASRSPTCDSRPTWDDTSVTAFALVITGGYVRFRGAAAAMALGARLRHLDFASSPSSDRPRPVRWSMLIVVAFPLGGAYAGATAASRAAYSHLPGRRPSACSTTRQGCSSLSSSQSGGGSIPSWRPLWPIRILSSFPFWRAWLLRQLGPLGQRSLSDTTRDTRRARRSGTFEVVFGDEKKGDFAGSKSAATAGPCRFTGHVLATDTAEREFHFIERGHDSSKALLAHHARRTPATTLLVEFPACCRDRVDQWRMIGFRQ